MKIAIKLCLLCALITFISFNSLSQSCSDGTYEWADAMAIFDSNGCASSTCHGGGASGLDLTSYNGFNAGGTKCADEISVGTTLIDIIVSGGVSCADGTVANPMNSLIASPVSQADLDDLQAWIDAGSFEFCPGTPLDDGVCDPATTIGNLPDPGQATLCSDGSDALSLTPPTGSLPDVQIVVEVNGELITISDDGSFDTTILMEGDEVCYTPFTFDLAAINALLTTASQLCPILDCDATFDLVGVNQAVADLVAGGGLMDLNDALTFAGSFGNPIESVQSAGSTLDALNVQIGALLGNVCYATGESLCVSVVACGGPNTCPTVYLNDDNLPNLPAALCVGDLLELCFDIAVDEALFDANSIEFNYELLIAGSPATVTLMNTYSSGTAIDANATGQICFSAAIPAGASACEDYELSLEIESVFYRDADCPDDFVAYDLNLTSPLAVMQTGDNLNDLVPLLGIAGLNPILVQVYPAPGWSAAVTQAPACDGTTLGIVEISAADGTLCDTVTDLGTAGADGECPANNAEFPAYTYTAFETFVVPDQNDMDSIVVNPCAVEIVVPAQTIECMEACGPCMGDEVEVTFSVDMSCSNTTARPPVVTGPFNGFSGDGNIMIDPDGDDIWEAVICAAPGSTFEYKYAIQDFVEQENLVDDAIGGASGLSCNLNTNFFDFSNRLITIPDGGGALPTDGYGICGSCDDPPINVTFSVNMNCSDVAPGTSVAMFGSFNDFCCPYGLQDADGDNVWTTTLPFPTDDSGCISMQYLYMSPDFSNVESFLTNGEDLASCDNIFTDFNEFANRIVEVCADVVLDEYWETCSAPAEPAGGCDDGDCTNGTESWDGCACVSGEPTGALGCTDPAFCEYDPNADCDDGSCLTSNADPGTCNTDCTAGDLQTWDAATCSCVASVVSVLGCTDATACNYDDNANCDDGNCDAGNTACADPCNEPDPDDGCDITVDSFDAATCTVTNEPDCPDGFSFNATACECTMIEVDGCTDNCDPAFNPDSTNESLCEGYSTDCNSDCTMGDITVWDAASCSCVVSVATVLGCTDATACNYDASANCDDGNCDFGNTACSDPCNEPDPDDGCDLTIDSFDAATCTVTNEPDCPEDTSFDAGNCSCTTIVVDGCLDPCDPAFNPDSTNDDLCEGYSTACNTDCTMGDLTVWDAASCSCVVETVTVLGCTDPAATNYNATANCDDDSCMFEVIVDGCTDPCDPAYNPDSTNDDLCQGYSTECNTDCTMGDLTVWDAVSCSCVVETVTVLGCTDPAANNYDATANCDNNMCEFDMCTDPCAPNFGAAGVCNDYDMTCPEDTCFEINTWDPESCACITAIVDYNCDDNNDCTNDFVDEMLCECINEPIEGCGDCVPPTPGTIDCE